MRTIKEIDIELDKISKDTSELFNKERELEEERNEILKKRLLDSGYLGKFTWVVINKNGPGFILEPIFDNDLDFDKLQDKLGLYPHGSFKLDDDIEIIGDDRETYIIADIPSKGIKFIKDQGIKIKIDDSIVKRISSLEKELEELNKFTGQFKEVT